MENKIVDSFEEFILKEGINSQRFVFEPQSLYNGRMLKLHQLYTTVSEARTRLKALNKKIEEYDQFCNAKDMTKYIPQNRKFLEPPQKLKKPLWETHLQNIKLYEDYMEELFQKVIIEIILLSIFKMPAGSNVIIVCEGKEKLVLDESLIQEVFKCAEKFKSIIFENYMEFCENDTYKWVAFKPTSTISGQDFERPFKDFFKNPFKIKIFYV